MIFLKKLSFIKNIAFCLLLFFISNCIDPVEPEFDFQEGLIYIEAFVSTSPESSFVSVYESVSEFGVYQNVFLEGASVTFRNTETDVLVGLVEQEDVYVPPVDFVASAGESWELYITLADGRQYQSLSEKIAAPVAISSIEAVYEPELFFNEGENEFVPGHSILVSFNDPPDEVNYYNWRYRLFEPITVCEVCYGEGNYYRDGACQLIPGYTKFEYLTYLCDSDCWRIRFNEDVQIFADDFVNGTYVDNLPIANVPLYSKKNVSVEIQQFSLSPAAHQYYKILKDILDNNGGLNAPPPAALIGNMFSPNDSEEYVLGRFTAAAVSTASLFIKRSGIEEEPLNRDKIELITEGGFGVTTPFPSTFFAPCEETRYTTGITPENWIDNNPID